MILNLIIFEYTLTRVLLQENFQLVSQLLSNVTGLGTGLEHRDAGAPMVYIKHGKIKKMSRRKVQERFIFLVGAYIIPV